MGAVDKGLQPFRGRPLIASVVERLAPQVGPLLISANGLADRYAAWAGAVVDDGPFPDAGPLAGVLAGARACRTDWLMITPCDVPLLPTDVVATLAAARDDDAIVAIVARTSSGLHPTTCLLRSASADALEAFLLGGGRSVGAWIATTRHRVVSFDDERAFRNLNTLAELHAAESAGSAESPP